MLRLLVGDLSRAEHTCWPCSAHMLAVLLEAELWNNRTLVTIGCWHCGDALASVRDDCGVRGHPLLARKIGPKAVVAT